MKENYINNNDVILIDAISFLVLFYSLGSVTIHYYYNVLFMLLSQRENVRDHVGHYEETIETDLP